MKYILFLNEDLPYTVKLYRKILGTKAQHSSCIFRHMYRAENVVPNFISATISVERAVCKYHGGSN